MLGNGTTSHLGHVDLHDPVLLHQHFGVEGVAFDLGEFELFVVESVLVDDQDSAFAKVGDIGHECRRVHHDEGVQGVARGEDFFAGELNLKTGNTSTRTPWSPDLSREIGESGNIVARQCGSVGQLRTEQLHPIPRVTTEANGDAGNGFNLLGGRLSHCFQRRRVDCDEREGSAICQFGANTPCGRVPPEGTFQRASR